MQNFPYDSPIFRTFHEATSPDGRFRAWMSATEVSMSNPTSGTLQLSDGLQIDRCNPSFIWSDDSRFLAVPQWCYCLGLRLRQRALVLDVLQRAVFASKPLAWFVQPRSFDGGVLVVEGEPTGKPREFAWRLPEELSSFRRIAVAW